VASIQSDYAVGVCSAISPSAIGGTGVAVVFVHKEGISVGKSAAIVMATSFLDELYFIIMFPLMIFAVGPETLFTIGETTGLNFANQFFYFAVIGYSIKLVYNLFLSYGLFINPVVIKKTILAIFSIRFLRRWRNDARRAGLDIINNSKELKQKSFWFWAKSYRGYIFVVDFKILGGQCIIPCFFRHEK
jgi:hypothetical protein